MNTVKRSPALSPSHQAQIPTSDQEPLYNKEAVTRWRAGDTKGSESEQTREWICENEG